MLGLTVATGTNAIYLYNKSMSPNNDMQPSPMHARKLLETINIVKTFKNKRVYISTLKKLHSRNIINKYPFIVKD